MVVESRSHDRAETIGFGAGNICIGAVLQQKLESVNAAEIARKEERS
jgi:hypothetical protein